MKGFIQICCQVMLTNPLELSVETGEPNYVLHHDKDGLIHSIHSVVPETFKEVNTLRLSV